MSGTRAGSVLRRAGVTPLVRAAHSQREVDYLPPFGDPEVHVAAEIAAAAFAGGAAAVLADRLRSY